MSAKPELTAKDFTSSEEVRWCPGCGDYAILKTMTQTLAKLVTWRRSKPSAPPVSGRCWPLMPPGTGALPPPRPPCPMRTAGAWNHWATSTETHRLVPGHPA